MKRLGLVLAVLVLPVLASGQSMAAAAKKEKERRQKAEQANRGKAKTYSQESVVDAPPLANDPNAPPAVSASAPESSGSASEGPASSDANPAASRDAEWSARINAARQRVSEARKEYEYWQKYTLVPGYVLAESSGRPVVFSIEELQARTRAARAKLDAAEAALADLLEQARKANVTPGALR